MKTKKGLEFVILISLLMGIVIGVLMLYYLYSLTYPLEKKTDLEACRISILANAKIKGKTLSIIEAQLSCPAEKLSLEYKDKKSIAKDIANQMKDCWYKTGEGNLPVGGQNFIKAGSFCMVCSEFGVKEELPVDIVKEELNNKILFTDKSYMDYLNVLGQPKAPSTDIFFIDVSNNVPQKLSSFSSTISYFVVFLRQQKSIVQDFFSPVSDFVATLIGKLSGEELINDAQTVFVIPRDKISELKMCQELYWEIGNTYVRK